MSGRSDILRGMLTRFLPAAVVGSFAIAQLLSAFGRFAPSMSHLLLGVTGTALLATVGATGALLSMRRRLSPDADVRGRKSVVSGALASSLALALLGLGSDVLNLAVALPFIGGRVDIFALPPGDLALLLALPIASGALLTVGTYFPWLSRAPITSTQPGLTSGYSSLPADQSLVRGTGASARSRDPLPNEEL